MTLETQVRDPWSIEVGGGAGGDYVLCPAGNYGGRIVGLLDIGQQAIETRDRGLQWIRKLVLIFELDQLRDDGQPHVLAKSYTWSMRETANLYKLVATLTGLKPRDGERFDLVDLLNCPVMVGITNSDHGERVFHDIASIAQFPNGYAPPRAQHTPVMWSVCSGERFPADSDWFPFLYGKSLKQLAMESDEGRARIAAMRGERSGGDAPRETRPAPAPRETKWGNPPAPAPAPAGSTQLRDLGPPTAGPTPPTPPTAPGPPAGSPQWVDPDEIAF